MRLTENDVASPVRRAHAVRGVVQSGIVLQHITQHEVPRHAEARGLVAAAKPHFFADGNVLAVTLHIKRQSQNARNLARNSQLWRQQNQSIPW